jgi:hypothetical protein
VCGGGFIHVFAVNHDESGKGHGLTRGSEQGLRADGNVHADRIELSGGHLTGHRALPDHFIETELIGRKMFTQAFRSACNGGRANGLMGFLGIFAFVGVVKPVSPAKFCRKICLDVVPDVCERFRGKVVP